MKETTSQQEFLRASMAELGELLGLGRPFTRDEMCGRLGCPRATFDKWMLEGPNGREIPSTMWSHVREVIAHEKLRDRVRKSLA